MDPFGETNFSFFDSGSEFGTDTKCDTPRSQLGSSDVSANSLANSRETNKKINRVLFNENSVKYPKKKKRFHPTFKSNQQIVPLLPQSSTICNNDTCNDQPSVPLLHQSSICRSEQQHDRQTVPLINQSTICNSEQFVDQQSVPLIQQSPVCSNDNLLNHPTVPFVHQSTICNSDQFYDQQSVPLIQQSPVCSNDNLLNKQTGQILRQSHFNDSVQYFNQQTVPLTQQSPLKDKLLNQQTVPLIHQSTPVYHRDLFLGQESEGSLRQPGNQLEYDIKESNSMLVMPEDKFIKDPNTSSGMRNFPVSNKIKEEIMTPSSFKEISVDEHIVPVSQYNSRSLEQCLYSWAYSSGVVASLEKQCDGVEQFGDNTLVYQFKVALPVQDILEFDQLLGDILLRNPISFLQLMKKVCFHFLHMNGMLKSLHTPEQLIITPIITHMPRLKEHTLVSTDRQSLQSKYGRLISMDCQIVSLSCSVQYTKSATYSCPSGSDCAWRGGSNCVLLTCDIGMIEADIIRNDYPCSSCGAILEENVSQRNLAEKKFCYVISNTSCSKDARLQGIKAVLKDDLKDVVHVGGYFMLTGVIRHDIAYSFNSVHQDACVTFEVLSVDKEISFTNRTKPYEIILPDTLCSLYNDRIVSPWSFVASLAYSFLDYVTPPGTYYLFKLCLLINLIMEDGASTIPSEQSSYEKETSKKIHILVKGGNVLPYQRLMKEASTYSSVKPIVHKPPMDLFATIHKEDNQLLFVTGGSLLLASSSVCVIPNLLELKKTECEKLRKVCEFNQISMNMPQNHQEQRHVILSTQSTLWCCSEVPNLLTNKETSAALDALYRQFHIVFHEDKKHEEPHDSILIEDTLKKASGKHYSHVMITSSDMKEYMASARKTQVLLPKDVNNLLQAFYLTNRKLNDSNAMHSDMDTLLHLAKGHAKAMLRNEVTINDAIMSIYIYEQLYALRNGDSFIGVKALSHFNQEEMVRQIGPQNDEKMSQLKNHIIQHCSNHFPELIRHT